MDFLLYIQKLQNELKALNLPKEKIHTIITQEYALAETQDSSSLQSFFTLVRLETILTQAMKQNSIFSPEDEAATIAPQGCLKNKAIRIIDEEKTILPSPKATLQSLTDEATMVVISGNANDAFEEKTMAASPDLKKLLSENETVRISEKDTVFFKDELDTTPTILKEDETIQRIPITPQKSSSVDVDATLPAYKTTTTRNEPVTEQTQPIPSGVLEPKKKNEEKTSATPNPEKKVTKNETESSVLPLSAESIRNPHPHISFFWLAFLLIPSICFLAVMIATFVLFVDFLFLLAFTAVMLFYLSVLLIPLFFVIYSVVFAFLYWQDFRIAEGVTEFGLTLFLSGFSLLFGYLFYRPFIVTAEWIGEKCKSFNRKTFRLLRNLYRYSVKGAEKI